MQNERDKNGDRDHGHRFDRGRIYRILCLKPHGGDGMMRKNWKNCISNIMLEWQDDLMGESLLWLHNAQDQNLLSADLEQDFLIRSAIKLGNLELMVIHRQQIIENHRQQEEISPTLYGNRY
jgi:hypothetical protein